MKVHNTLTRSYDELVPRDEGKVGIYVCGPTVQSEPHLGHGRSAVAFDVLWRYLEWSGYEVEFVRNVTDVDDKIIARAAERGITTEQVAAEAYSAFDAGYTGLGNRRPTVEPRATEHIPHMVAMIESLIEKGHAYEADGDVYFSVSSFPSYGKLSGNDVDDLVAGNRVEPGVAKRDPADFALWKAAKPGEPSWDSPWGAGRPGWHIECSAMAAEYLGTDFDVHGGGTDLIFPHHENEMAQAEAAMDRPFARYWMHNGMLNLSGEKMAKSTGHVVSLLGALERWDPMAVRLFYLRTHYRKPLDFSESALDDAEASLARIRAFVRRVSSLETVDPDEDVLVAFRSHMDDDLDVAGALGVVFDTVRTANAALDEGRDAGAAASAVLEMLEVLGLAQGPDRGDEVDVSGIADSLGIEAASVDDLVAARDTARAERDWPLSDGIRDALAEVGIVIEDTADGTRWHRS